MTTRNPAETLAWLGIDVWQRRVAPPAPHEAVVPGEDKAIDDNKAGEAKSVATPPAEAGSVDAGAMTATSGVSIRAPAAGPLRRLAEQIAAIAAVPRQEIELVSESDALVRVDGQTWALSRLIQLPEQKRALWRCLIRR